MGSVVFFPQYLHLAEIKDSFGLRRPPVGLEIVVRVVFGDGFEIIKEAFIAEQFERLFDDQDFEFFRVVAEMINLLVV